MKLLSMDEACEVLGIAKKTLYTMVSQRRIKHCKIGRFIKFEESDLIEFVASCKR